MSAHREPTTIRVRWRQVAAMVPAILLAATGIALAVSGHPGSDGADLPDVPQQALQQPDRTGSSIEPATSGPQAADPGLAPGLGLPPGVPAGSSQLVQLDRLGIPAAALAAYQLAAKLVAQADPACGIDWALLGAIGRVESDHARFGGNALDSNGIARPGIIGVPLDGTNGTARITDTDDGVWDRDTTYDRAVGPMQFIPGTWRIVGADADADGRKDPQDMSDAATGTAIYLCSGPGDLRRSADLRQAVLRYNNSDQYARTVIAIADAYRHGVAALPAASLPAAHDSSGGTSNIEAAGARPATSSSAAGGRPATGAGQPATSAAGGPANGAGAGGGAGAGSGNGPAAQPTAPPLAAAVGSVGSAASSGVSSAVSLVTSVVTRVVQLPTPIVTTTTPCIIDVLGVRVCTPTTISSTTTTITSTHRP